MTKPLPKRDVEARVTRQGEARLTAVERKALSTVKDKSLRKAVAELLISTRDTQENFQTIEQWFPIQPHDVVALRPKVWPDNTTEGRPQESAGGEEGTKGKWRVLSEFRYRNELGVLGVGNIPALVNSHTAGTNAFVNFRIANFDKSKTLTLISPEIASATELIPGTRFCQPVAVKAGTQADQFFGSLLSPELWEVDEDAWPNGEPCQLEVRAANENTVIPGEYPKAFMVVVFGEGTGRG